MKAKEQHFKQLSVPLQKTASETRWDSPIRTPTTVASFSSSSQDFAVRSSSPIIPIQTKAKEQKSFQEEYLEFGLWPELSLLSQRDLKTRYKAQKVKSLVYQTEIQLLQTQLSVVSTTPCQACAAERARHECTKRALEEAVALSSALLRQVMDMDCKQRNVGNKSGKRAHRSAVNGKE